MFYRKNVCLLYLLFFFGCQSQTEQTVQTVSQAYFNSGPQLVKISTTNTASADSLIKQGLDVIVIEEDYVIAKMSGSDVNTVQAMTLNMQTFKEEELVQRLIKIVMNNQSNLQDIGEIGIDIWEVKGDTVVAQAFDKYIRQLEAKGYTVEIVEKNVQNVLKKLN
jgi:arginyl-tRNA synthetase